MKTVLFKRLRQRDENGYVIALVSISLLALTLIAAFGVDLGAWYLQATKLQRAADASALAGAMMLPDTDDAAAEANALYGKNGFTNSPSTGVTITNDITAEEVRTTVTDSRVPTYFLRWLMPNVTVTRHSVARRATGAPHLGSPYNVLGTGDLQIGTLPKQNFWLAINGACSPAEDGDYFAARWDLNKGPFTGAFNADGARIPSATAKTHCAVNGAGQTDPSWPQRIKNANYSPAGYSYFVDIPVPPTGTSNPHVDIRVYDGAFGQLNNDQAPDIDLGLTQDTLGAGIVTKYTVTNETDPNNVELMDQRIIQAYDGRPNTKRGWITLTTVPGNKLTAGAHLRIQVETYNGLDDDRARTVAYGVNSFSLGAFASWKGSGITGCNSIGDIYCPNVYGREAISVYNSLNPGPNGKVLYPLAELDPTLSGRTFTLYLWDPGEGAESISIVGPNKTSLIPFSYTVSGGNGYAGNGVTSIDTSNSGCNPATRCPQPNNSTLSNGDKFNDRLITIKFQLPPEYTQEVTDTGNDWTYLQYKVGSSPSDRITYGLETGDSRTAPPHLVRWGS